MRLRLMAAVIAGAWLAATPLTAQVRSTGQSGSIRFTPPPPAPTQLPTPAPTPPPAPAPQPGRDLYLAGPETYAPHYDQLNQSLFFPGTVGYAGYPAYIDPSGRSTTVIIQTPAAAPAAPVAAPAPAAPPPPPAPQKTFYVIPRCYSGDAPPRAELLPAGCSVANLRRIDPR